MVITNQKLIQWFLKYLQNERQYSALTVKSYQRNLAQFTSFIEETAGNQLLTAIDKLDVETYMTHLNERQYSKTTISQKVSSLKSFYNFLVKNQQMAQNPFDYVHLKNKSQRLPKFIYDQELQILFQTAKQHHNHLLALRNSALLELLYATGIRVAECASLKLADINLTNQIVLVTGKGNKQRYVPFGKPAQEALVAYLDHARIALLNQGHQEHDMVFVNNQGAPITTRGIEYILDEIIKQSSLTINIHPHMLRHTFATAMLNNGADMRTVQELLGHSSLSSTQIYTHVTKDHLMQQYNQFFSRTKDN